MTIAALPLITRIYSPEDFGIVATWTFFCGFMQLLASLRLEYSIIRASDNLYGLKLLRSARRLAFILSVVSGSLASFIIASLSDADFLQLSLVFIANIFFGALYQLYLAFSLREGKTRFQMEAAIIQVLTGISSQIIFGIVSPSPYSFLWGVNLGLFIGTCFLVVRHRQHFVQKVSRIDFKTLVMRHKSDMSHGILHSCLAITGRGFPAPFIAFQGFENIAGQFVLVYKMILNPMFVVANSVGRALMHEISKSAVKVNDDNAIYPWLKLIYLCCVLISLIATSLSKSMLIHVLGADWEIAASFSSVLILAAPSMFVYELAVSSLIAKDNQKSITSMRMLQILTGVMALAFLNFGVEARTVITIFAVVLIVNSSVGIFFSDRHSRSAAKLSTLMVLVGLPLLGLRHIAHLEIAVRESFLDLTFIMLSSVISVVWLTFYILRIRAAHRS